MNPALIYFIGIWAVAMALLLMGIRACELHRESMRDRVTPLEDERNESE